MAEHHATGSEVERIGYPVHVTRATVRGREWLNPSMIRLTVGGPEVGEFHSYQADDHVIILFPDDDGGRRVPTQNADLRLDWPSPHPPGRKYTIRRFDRQAQELDLDFVVHDGGLASTWVQAVEPGEEVVMAGPPGAASVPHTFDHYIFAVDSTALPAVARWLDEFPGDLSADVIVEIAHDHERNYPLAERSRVRVQWIVRGAQSGLADAVRALQLPPGRTFLFAAGEADDIRPLRREPVDVVRLITGYWKRGTEQQKADLH